MIYLILDTNIWLYLANSYNPKKESFDDGLHFKLVENIERFVNEEKITILTNEIIIEEWDRNIETSKNLIKKHKKSVEGNKGCITNIKKILDKPDKEVLDSIFNNYSLKMQQVIEKNENHISQVQGLLSNAEKVEVSDSIKAAGADRALKK